MIMVINICINISIIITNNKLKYEILDFKGFDLSRILMFRGGILMSTGDSAEDSSRRILAGIILAGILHTYIYIYIYNIILTYNIYIYIYI